MGLVDFIKGNVLEVYHGPRKSLGTMGLMRYENGQEPRVNCRYGSIAGRSRCPQLTFRAQVKDGPGWA